MSKPRDGDSDKLWVASCIHIGAVGHDRAAFEKQLGWVKKVGADVALIGDVIDTGLCFGTKHIGSVWDNDKNPDQQLDAACEALGPIRKQIRSISTGNHEMRMEKLTSISPLKQLAKRLGAPYHGPNHIMRWNGLNVFLAHGATSGLVTDFAKVMQAYEGIDVIVLGHVHHKLHQTVRRFVVDGRLRRSERIVHFIRAGSYLRDAPYARLALHTATDIGSPVLRYDKSGLTVTWGPR